MRLDLRYQGRSELRAAAWGVALRLAPNLARPQVFFDAELLRPLHFREAISALHDVVVGDLKFHRRDKTAYLEWKKDEERKEAALRAVVYDKARKAELAKLADEAPPPGLEGEFRKMHALYWKARRKWADELRRNDPELFRHLVPCDPVVTVAPDTVFFECFSKDESSYGCLFVERDAFRGEGESALGTTNVDYSLSLFEHFQGLRSYRATRLTVDPSGFGVSVEGSGDFREEKIDLPSSWLRGFGQLQAAMTLPHRKVALSREAVYSVLAYLKRHREKTGPRSLRFRLTPGRPVELVLDPWGVAIPAYGAPYEGDRTEEIKTWGRRRLFALARLLPLADSLEVRLLGSGLPSLWTVRMGEMRFVLALSGWTTNDWTAAANLDLLAGTTEVDAPTVARLEAYLEKTRTASLAVLEKAIGGTRAPLVGSLHRLAKQGQVMVDFTSGCYRYRPVMPAPLSEAVLGPESPELSEALRLFRERKVTIVRSEPLAAGRILFAANVDREACEGILDLDGFFSKAKCGCRFFHRAGLRGGPCRHLLALRLAAQRAQGGERPN